MRREFSKHVKLARWKLCGGRCEWCDIKLYPGHIEYHHDKEDTFGGDPTVENCRVLCTACHLKFTRDRAKVIAKSNRVLSKHIGIKRRGRPMPGSKLSGFRKKMDGSVERR